MIPKKIHYIWVGDSILPKDIENRIQNWKKIMPEYEFFLWNEKNFPIENSYTKQMYHLKKWAFVSDYIRFWVLYNYGGIYLDTDMDVLKSFDDLLTNNVFFGRTSSDGYISCGIIGSRPNNIFIKSILDYYNSSAKKIESKTSPRVVTSAFEKFSGNKNQIRIYDPDIFYPCNVGEKCTPEKTKNAYTNHLWDESWVRLRLLRKFFRKAGILCVIKNLIKKDPVFYNSKIHNKIVKKYEKIHIEIFNDLEQKRITSVINYIKKQIKNSDSKQARVLDIGCGTGNLTSHFKKAGFSVVSADISQKNLEFVKNKFGVETVLLNGEDLSNIKENTFEVVSVYSVLHHIPDYLKIINEMCRVIKPGGIIYIDHEKTDSFWEEGNEIQEFYKKQRKFLLSKKVKRIFDLDFYTSKIRRLLNPRFQLEGDIHVFKDDHIEWTEIKKIFNERGFTLLSEKDYLNYNKLYNLDVFNEYKDKISDTKLLIIKK